MMKFLTQEAARLIDERLMGDLAFSIDQLMELAGLSVAQAVSKEKAPSPILIICGPGNNGGDGLVAARHLHHFGFSPSILYPKPTQNPLYLRLIHQCETLEIPILSSAPSEYESFPLILDAIFGFSFKGEIRPPFDEIISSLKSSSSEIISVDIPSGWDIEEGNFEKKGLEPCMLVSLTAPKLCASEFGGIHYVGGRFVPQSLAEEFNIEIPAYQGSDQIVRIN